MESIGDIRRIIIINRNACSKENNCAVAAALSQRAAKSGKPEFLKKTTANQIKHDGAVFFIIHLQTTNMRFNDQTKYFDRDDSA
jgi:hypothetical protein